MLKSVLISVLSACLAVCTTLLIQQWASLSSLQHVPATLVDEPKMEIVSPKHQEDQDNASTSPESPAAVDLAQALGLGRVLLSRGEHEEAALVYRVASTAASTATSDAVAGTNRDLGEAQHGLGLALLAAGRAEDALEACREAELADPELAAASSCVGALLTDAGDTAGALEAFRHAVEKADRVGGTAIVPREAEGAADNIRGRLGAALLAAGEVDEAIATLEMRAGGDPHAAYNLGVAWQSKVCSTLETACMRMIVFVKVPCICAICRVNLMLATKGPAEASYVGLEIRYSKRDNRKHVGNQSRVLHLSCSSPR